MVKGISLSATSWTEIKNKKFDIAILPWGATEPHNYHLPYGTDCILSESVAIDSVVKASKEGVKSIVLPSIPLGSQNPGQTDFPFCLHTRLETQKSVLQDIVMSLNSQGIKKILIINGHGGNNFRNIIRDLAVEFPDFMIAITDWYKVADRNGYFENPGDHADELETSVMMHYHPELVLDLSEAGDGSSNSFSISALKNGQVWMPRNWQKVSIDTGIGNPIKSTAEKGKAFADQLTDTLATFLVEFARVENENDLYF